MELAFASTRLPWRHERKDLESEGNGRITLVDETPEERFITVIDGDKHWRPPIRHHLGHSPDVLIRKDGRMYAGCTCGWRSRNRTNDGIASWWQHTRKEEKKSYT